MDMIKYNTPQELFTAICDKIRDKTNSNKLINHQDIPNTIKNNTKGINDITNINNIIDDIIQNDDSTSNYRIKDNSVSFIRSSIFENCTNLISIDFYNCIYMKAGAFYGCTNLTTVNLPECTVLNGDMFTNCTNLTTVNLPKCKRISYGNFIFCTNLTTINLPKCIELGYDGPGHNGYGNFHDCTNLTTVNLPECTSIRDYAFTNCTNLTIVILGVNSIVSIEDVFINTPIANGTGYVYVPDSLVDSYKADTNWSTYANSIKPISELPSNLKEEYEYE